MLTRLQGTAVVATAVVATAVAVATAVVQDTSPAATAARADTRVAEATRVEEDTASRATTKVATVGVVHSRGTATETDKISQVAGTRRQNFGQPFFPLHSCISVSFLVSFCTIMYGEAIHLDSECEPAAMNQNSQGGSWVISKVSGERVRGAVSRHLPFPSIFRPPPPSPCPRPSSPPHGVLSVLHTSTRWQVQYEMFRQAGRPPAPGPSKSTHLVLPTHGFSTGQRR